MRLAYYIKKAGLASDPAVRGLLEQLSGPDFELYPAEVPGDIRPGTDALLSLGGDGTFLYAARIAVPSDIPVLGVNFGRLGFLSDAKPSDVAAALRLGEFSIESRTLLHVSPDREPVSGAGEEFWPYAFNETSVSRVSASMLGVSVEADGQPLPTYWADGLLIATSSGSTAYSLSVGGPIVTPECKVFIVAPVSPHNLNVRPLVVPEDSKLRLSLSSRDETAVLTVDNRNYTIPADTVIGVEAAPVSLRRMRIARSSSFIGALRTRLLWGEDLRNGK